MTTTESHDTHIFAMYAAAFQRPLHTIRCLREAYAAAVEEWPRSLREDFCGTAENSIAWVKFDDQSSAIAIDIDHNVLEYCRNARLPSLRRSQRERLRLLHGNVLDYPLPHADIAIAMNSSFWVFKERSELKRYFENAIAAFDGVGMLALEVYCGPDAQNLGVEEIPCNGFTAVWEQAAFDPVSNHCVNYIHFILDEGTSIPKAFTYDWRLWSPPECIDLMAEVGFRDIETLKVNAGPQRDDWPTDSSLTLLILGFK